MWDCLRDFLGLFSVFVRYKVAINKNKRFTDYASRIQFPNCSKLAINQKNDNDVIIYRHEVIVKSFGRRFVYLFNFSYRSKFHVSIITGSGVMTDLFHKGLNKNLEIGNPISGDWGKLGIPYLVQRFSNEMLMNAAKCQGYSFYCF